MKKLFIILISILSITNIFTNEFKLPEGLVYAEEKSFVDKFLDKFRGQEKLTKAKTDTFSLTCEGEMVSNYYNNYSLYDNKKEMFFEDFEIEVSTYKNKKTISSVHMSNSSHHYHRDVWYYPKDIIFHTEDLYKKNLSVSKDNMQISLQTLNRHYDPEGDDIKTDVEWDTAPTRISLKSGIYSGQFKGVLGNTTVEYQFRSKCAGGSQIIKFMSSDKSGYLNYWWAVILIIAITFFIFTQSGKRLKKIRRK